MDLLEIDPKLFITCRLCLEDTGVYQIVPTVQQQIKYCFDINVAPFDGLPQLLCKKCHTLLNDYSTVKKTFIDKQVTLKEKLSLKKEELPEQSVVTGNDKVNESAHGGVISGHNEVNVSGYNDVNISVHNETNVSSQSEANISAQSEVNVTAQKKKFSKSKRRKRVLSTSSTESVDSNKTLQKVRKNTPKKSSSKGFTNWKRKYTKYLVCKICSLMYKDKKSIKSHFYSHSYIRAKHHDVFDVKCMVNLPKLDKKPNITGLNNAVVLSKKRIVQDDNSDLYHILYLAKSIQYSKSDTSDCEIFVSSKQRKRRRLDSLSSNETVCIGNNNESPEAIDTKVSNNTKPKNELNNLRESKDAPICIELDDSSDTDIDASKDTKENNFNTLKLDMKVIENIVTVCRNKYEMRLKKTQLSDNISRAQMDSQLKKKLLSFGRKNINVKDFNTTGLLRYLEHKNLNVLWEPVSPKRQQLAGREHSFVRVGATLMNNDKRGDEDAGWIDVAEPRLDTEPCDSVNQCIPVASSTAILNKIPTEPPVVVTSSDSVNQIVLSDIRTIEENNSKKLLNENPVANPKQLPKKNYAHDSKQLVTKRHSNFDPGKSEEQINELNLVMPVITSTKSLAVEVNDETKKKDVETENAASNNVIDKVVPRIKVKPVSELMNPQNIIPTNHHNPLWNYNQVQNGTEVQENMANLFVSNTLVSQIQSQSMPILPVGTPMTEAPKSNSDFIILDTVDMPNTKTDSPFEYFRNLLQLHGFVLTEANADITRDYVCLLKFKVQFKQENKSNPVTLCLSLHCAGNKFCMSIKDGNQINIHIAKMSANWQWEIIKVYQGDVSTKILHNAQKAGQHVYTNTNTFLCLLKSITHKQGQ